MSTGDPDYDVPCDQACDAYKDLLAEQHAVDVYEFSATRNISVQEAAYLLELVPRKALSGATARINELETALGEHRAALREAWTSAVVICNLGSTMDDDEKERLVSMNIEHSLKVAHDRNLASAVVGFVANSGPAIGGH